MIKQTLTQGIVLARTNFQEADRILTLLTPDQGKLRLLAKGVRKSKSKLAGGVELFSVSEIGFIRGKGDIGTLTTARLQQHYGKIVQDITRTTVTYELLKRLDKITEDNAEREYFDLLRQTLEALDDTTLNLGLLQLWFDMQLLKITGHSPSLRNDAEHKPLVDTQQYNFDLEAIGFRSHPEGMYQTPHLKLLRLCQSQPASNLDKVTGTEAYVQSCLLLSGTIRKHILHI